MGSFPNNGPETSSRNGEENSDKRKDRQLTGQTSLTPFISIKEGFSKKVTFDTMDGIQQKIGKLTVMMGKLVMESKGQNRPFKPQICQSNRSRGKTRCQLPSEKISRQV